MRLMIDETAGYGPRLLFDGSYKITNIVYSGALARRTGGFVTIVNDEHDSRHIMTVSIEVSP